MLEPVVLEIDPFITLDQEFNGKTIPTARVERLFAGCRWAEGPAYFPSSRQLIWSDIPNDRLLRYDEQTGSISVFRSIVGNTNGNTIDRQGRLVSCEHGNRRVTRTEHDGTTTVLASHHRGKRLNSPNDVVVKSDNSIWFTDPAYGIDSDYEGNRAEPEIDGCHVYRIDPQSGEAEIVADDFIRPNGLAFSADESMLYVSDTGATHAPDGPRHIRKFKVENGCILRGGETFAECSAGLFDGFRIDTDEYIWASAGDGVHCISPGGALIGKVLLPEVAANVVFGGPKRNRLFICASRSLYSVLLPVNGLKTF